jgi:hypothetical protein
VRVQVVQGKERVLTVYNIISSLLLLYYSVSMQAIDYYLYL